ncbi:sigma-54-dependent transcriptional regulator [Aquimonas sp.]|jgi:DNA-binding NtrC family response regulator|uniref:sigma-54-dependent transcriptional regulator n=1 Tax=Aquimonas sp. TaxID=1872588 RepID=UPI0037BEE42C
MSTAPARILIADDQADVLSALRLLLKSEGHACVTVEGPAEALDRARRESFDAALIDLNYTRDTTSGEEGLALLAELKRASPELPVVVMTAWGNIDLAVRAMRDGAADFIEKPWDNRRLLSVLGSQIALAHSQRRARRLESENRLLREGEGVEPFVAEAASMRPVLDLLGRVAPSDANVLILGENGTGKGLLARELHRRSRRAAQSLVKVNMGGIAETVFESEMFGHVRGAFTDAKVDRIGRFELADGGTLFLDEIANIPPSQQPKLLRVLEDGELERVGSSRTLKVDVRLVSATNADLPAEVAAGRFRKDLLYRLNTVELRLPPLRERREDIAPMARDFLARAGARYQRTGLRFAPSALRALEQHHWPGNVRELAHVVERAVLMARGDLLEQLDLGVEAEPVVAAASGLPAPGSMTLEQAEQAMIRNALDQCRGNIQRAAELLGLSRGALYRRLEKYGLAVEE